MTIRWANSEVSGDPRYSFIRDAADNLGSCANGEQQQPCIDRRLREIAGNVHRVCTFSRPANSPARPDWPTRFPERVGYRLASRSFQPVADPHEPCRQKLDLGGAFQQLCQHDRCVEARAGRVAAVGRAGRSEPVDGWRLADPSSGLCRSEVLRAGTCRSSPHMCCRHRRSGSIRASRLQTRRSTRQ